LFLTHRFSDLNQRVSEDELNKIGKKKLFSKKICLYKIIPIYL